MFKYKIDVRVGGDQHYHGIFNVPQGFSVYMVMLKSCRDSCAFALSV